MTDIDNDWQRLVDEIEENAENERADLDPELAELYEQTDTQVIEELRNM